jgi:hypothetical protein
MKPHWILVSVLLLSACSDQRDTVAGPIVPILIARERLHRPPAPKGLVASLYAPGAFGGYAVRLGWSPVAGATGYAVYRHTGPNVHAETRGLVCCPGLIDDTVPQHGRAYYRVAALDPGGESAKSGPVSIVVP